MTLLKYDMSIFLTVSERMAVQIFDVMFLVMMVFRWSELNLRYVGQIVKLFVEVSIQMVNTFQLCDKHIWVLVYAKITNHFVRIGIAIRNQNVKPCAVLKSLDDYITFHGWRWSTIVLVAFVFFRCYIFRLRYLAGVTIFVSSVEEKHFVCSKPNNDGASWQRRKISAVGSFPQLPSVIIRISAFPLETTWPLAFASSISSKRAFIDSCLTNLKKSYCWSFSLFLNRL